jgi:hypothetical protein
MPRYKIDNHPRTLVKFRIGLLEINNGCECTAVDDWIVQSHPLVKEIALNTVGQSGEKDFLCI